MNDHNNGDSDELNRSFTETTDADSQPEFSDREVDPAEADSPEFRVKELEGELKAAQQDYLRALADIENMKKRQMKERSELLKYQGEKILVDVIEVTDNFDLAMQSEQIDQAGIKMIHGQLQDLLKKWQVESKSKVGDQFDPAFQEALSKQPDANATPGAVINEFKKTYFYKDRLIRPGQVVVAAAAPAESADTEETSTETEH